MRAARTRMVTAMLAAPLLAGCVSPSRTYDDYEHKAANTAEAAVGAVETARTAVETAERGNAFGPYLSVTVAEAEDDTSAAQATFDSVQPPGARADGLRDELDKLLQSATDALSSVRIAARRGDTKSMHEQLPALAAASKALDEFEKSHS